MVYAQKTPRIQGRPGPGFTGTQKSGQVLTCAPGVYTGVGTVTPAYQWENKVLATGVVSNCGGAGTATAAYTLAAGDEGDLVRCKVTLTDGTTTFTNVFYTMWSGVIVAP